MLDISTDYLHVPGSATVGEVLRTYVDRDGQWWWLLTYLTGRTSHIVHSIGDCPVCGSMDPMLWRGTGALVEEALADRATCARLVSDLPMAELPVMEAEEVNPYLLLRAWIAKRISANHRVKSAL